MEFSKADIMERLEDLVSFSRSRANEANDSFRRAYEYAKACDFFDGDFQSELLDSVYWKGRFDALNFFLKVLKNYENS